MSAIDSTAELLWLDKGSLISHAGRDYIILALADVDMILAREVGSDAKVMIKIGDVLPASEIRDTAPPKRAFDLEEVSEDDWRTAKERLDLIRPLMALRYRPNGALAKKLAVEANVNPATIYRWLGAYRQTESLSSLIPNFKDRGGRGKPRIAPEVESVINFVLEKHYDTEQRYSIKATVDEIRRLCSNAGLRLPSPNTVRSRIRQTDGREREKARKGEAHAREMFDPLREHTRLAEWPLGIVEIDHTELPVIIVDETLQQYGFPADFAHWRKHLFMFH
jgi:putative transposase